MTYLHTHTGPTLVTYNFYELSTWQEGEGEEKRERETGTEDRVGEVAKVERETTHSKQFKNWKLNNKTADKKQQKRTG